MKQFLLALLKQIDFKQCVADVLKQGGAPKRAYKTLEQKWIFAKEERALVNRNVLVVSAKSGQILGRRVINRRQE